MSPKNLFKRLILVSIILFVCLVPYQGIAQQSKIKFENISVEDGLSSYFVNCIIQDSRGFIWIGTKDGLNRFDGFNFIKYHFSSSDSTSISHDYVNAICEDPSKNGIWVGTNRGLNFFDYRTEKFTCFYHASDNSKSLCHNNVSSLSVCKWGGIWIGTRNGLDHLYPNVDVETGEVDGRESKFDHSIMELEGEGTFSEHSVNCIFEDNTGSLWIGYKSGKLDQIIGAGSEARLISHKEYKGGIINEITEDNSGVIWFVTNGAGLVKYDSWNKTFSNRLNRNKSGNWINAICKGTGGSLWLGTYNDGLTEISSPEKVQEFGADTTVFKRYQNIPEDLATLTDNWIRCLYMDQSGVLWAGTRRNGIVKVSFEKDNFKYHSYDKASNIIPELQEVNTIIETRDKLIWVGTALGLFTFNLKSREIENHNQIKEGKQVSPIFVFSLCEDKNGNIWVGTYGNGIYRYNIRKKKYSHFQKGNFNSLSSNQITSITSLRSGDLVIGTSSGGVDLIKANDLGKKEIEITSFLPDILPEHEKFTLRSKLVFEDSKGIIWITTVLDGLYKYNPFKQTLKHYPYDEKNPHSISDDHIASICEGKDGTIWIATDKGLDSFDVGKEIFTKYYTNDGLPDNTVIGVETDKNGHVWALTRKWISRFNPVSKEMKNFNYHHRVVTGMFANKRICETKDGEIFVGTQRKGFFSFNPDSILRFPYQPPVEITNLKVSGVTIPIGNMGKQTILSESINHAKQIQLTHDQNNISFIYSALSYVNQEDNKYACQLEGVQDNWQYLGKNRRSINYFNLNSGTYTFKVKASNYDGVWNEDFTSVKIKILPPWWRTWWAYTIYIFVLISLLIAFHHYTTIWITLKNNLKLEKMEKAKMEELNQLKLRFFTNISHEFRTPLTLLLGPIENLISKGSGDAFIQKQLGLMHRNGNRLLRLINQLMDFRKVENKQMKLNAQELDLVQFTHSIVELFAELAQQHNIELDFATDSEFSMVWVDEDKLDKILFNLLSNAFKFTPDGGKITVGLECHHNQVEISVVDNGKGIPSEQLHRIFDRFYQVEQCQVGTGIGLALTKSFVELHHGEISVSSELGKGSHFVVALPLGRQHLGEEEMLSSSSFQKDVDHLIPMEISSLEDMKNETYIGDYMAMKQDVNLPLVLIVEDNVSLRTFIRESLEHNFRIAEAGNGREAFDIAVKFIPDLIISDVMMPEMSGTELCEKIKSDDRTSHIPLVLLTALSAVEDIFTGYKSGADEYIPKPFNPQLLGLRIQKLIESNRNLKKRFQKEIHLDAKDITIASADEKLLVKIMNVIQGNLANAEFTVQKMGVEIGISRVHLNRKIKALTDQTAVDFIRTIRMKQAAKLLLHNKMNVSEIAYAVGFSNPISFGRSFKKHFGCCPSEYDAG